MERFLNLKERVDDFLEIGAVGFPCDQGVGYVFPDGESGPNKDTCPSNSLICIAHLPNDSNLVHKQAGARPG